jgi:hypothetical protein
MVPKNEETRSSSGFWLGCLTGFEPVTPGAVVVFKVPGDSKEPRNELGVLSKTLGRYRFLPHGTPEGIVKLRIRVPDAGMMKIGFRAWKNTYPLRLSSTFSIVLDENTQ